MSEPARNRSVLPAEEETVLMRFAGQVFQPLPSGGLFWPAQNALLVADLHLEKLSSFARLGQMLPPYDTAMTLRRLAADIARTGAQTLIALGDSFHRDEGVATLLEADRARIEALNQQVDWIWLSGNHDPAPHALGGQCYGEIIIDGNRSNIKNDDAMIVPAGARHNVINTGKTALQLYTIYAPPEHVDGTIRATKADAEALKEHFDGKTTE